MKRLPVNHRLDIGTSLKIKVYAGDKYSLETFGVKAGEQYHVHCPKGQWWVDMFIPATPNGYPNPLANLFGQRVKGTRCFCLCGAYDSTDNGALAIGSDKTFTVTQNGILSFFANDVPGFEWNNWGSIEVCVERIA